MSRFARPILPKKPVVSRSADVMPMRRSQSVAPWLDPTRWVRFEYQVVEMRLQDGKSYLRGERKVFEEGQLRQEQFSAEGGEELFQQAAEEMQQQLTQQMDAILQMMFLPWRMLPGFDRLLAKSGFNR